MTHRFLIAVLMLSACSPGADNNVDDDVNNFSLDFGRKDTSPDAGTVVDPNRPHDKIKVVTFNVKKFFDTQCDSGRCSDDDFEASLSDAEFNFRANQIVSAIQETDADIVLFQEFEKELCLDKILAEAPEYTVGAFGETFFSASLDVAIIAKGDLVDTIFHRDNKTLTRTNGDSERFAREFLEVHLDVQGHRVIVFSAHFKSKANDDPDWRDAEAKGAMEIIEEVGEDNPDALVVLGGDLNDNPDSTTLEILTRGKLKSVNNDEENFWTHRFGGTRQIIDYIVVYPTAKHFIVPDSVEVFRDQSGGLAGSDHAALAVDFGIYTD